MGGINHCRPTFYAGNTVSWRFRNDGDAEKIAILVPFSTPKELKLEFFNTDTKPMEVQMTGWDVLNGEWELIQGIDSNGVNITDRPDLAIGAEDIQISENQISVTVHNLGYVSAPPTEIALIDCNGKILQTATIPALEGVHDLLPKRVRVSLNIPPDLNTDNCQIVIDPKQTIPEIRKSNNVVKIK